MQGIAAAWSIRRTHSFKGQEDRTAVSTWSCIWLEKSLS